MPRRWPRPPATARLAARMSDVFLSVVLPCRDQEDHIEAVQLCGPLAPTRFELVVVPNACRDRTQVAGGLAAADERIRVRQPSRG